MRKYVYGKMDRGPIEFGSRIAEHEREIMKIARKNVVTVPPSISIKGAAETMVEYHTRRLPIVHPGTNVIQGIIVTRDIIDFLGGGEKYNIVTQKHNENFLAAINESVRSIMDKNVIYIRENYSVGATLKKLVNEGVGGFPILNKQKKVIGLIEEEDFVYNIAGLWAGTTVKNIMTKDVLVLTPGTNLKDTSRLMIKNSIRRVPMVSDDELVGVITTFDIIDYFASSKILDKMKSTNAEDALSIKISEITKKEPVTISPDEDLGKAVELMKKNNNGFLPVTEDKQLVGVVTERDILMKLIMEEYTWKGR